MARKEADRGPAHEPVGATGPATSPAPLEENPSPFRDVGRHALIYGLGMIISRAVSFIMLPIYLRYLTPADYGVMALVEMTLDFIAIIGGGQLALGIFRFYHKTERDVDRSRMVATSFFLVGVMYSVVGAVTAAAAEPLSRLIFGDASQVLVVRIAAVNLAASALVIVPMSLARVRDLSTLYVSANIGKLVVALTCNILFLVVMGMGVVGIFLSSLIANSLVGAVLVGWLVRTVGIRVSGAWAGQLLRYGVPLMGMQVATFVTAFSDRFFLQAAASEDVVGLYNLAYQFGFILAVVGFSPVEMIWGPRRFEIAKRPDRDEHLSRGFVMTNTILLTTGIGIVLFVEDVLRIMAGPEFHSAVDVIPPILVAYVLQSWAGVQDIGILVREKTQYLTLANVISALVAVIGYTFLIPRYLAWGAASATLVAFATRYGLTLYFSQRLWYVRYSWRPVLVLSAWVIGISAVSLLLPPLPILTSIGAHVGLLLAYALGVWFLPVLEDEDRAAALALAKSILHRARRRRTAG